MAHEDRLALYTAAFSRGMAAEDVTGGTVI